MTVEVVIESGPWDQAALTPLAIRAARAVLGHLGVDADEWEFTLLACDDAQIADLNRAFRGKPRPTNVLSWPSTERGVEQPGDVPAPPQPDAFGDTHLGDIAIAYETCAREAQAGGLVIDDHLTHLIIHAVLHLLGYDHETDADAQLMEGIESEVLGSMGISDPYWDHKDGAAHP